MKNIYDKRVEILNEPLSSSAFHNKGVHLRKHISRQQKIFEDRLASIVCNFSTKIDMDVGHVTEIAKELRNREFSNVVEEGFQIDDLFR